MADRGFIGSEATGRAPPEGEKGVVYGLLQGIEGLLEVVSRDVHGHLAAPPRARASPLIPEGRRFVVYKYYRTCPNFKTTLKMCRWTVSASPERGEGRGGKRPRRGAEGTARAAKRMAETTPAPPVFEVRPDTNPISPTLVPARGGVPTAQVRSKRNVTSGSDPPTQPQCGDKLAVDAYLKSLIEPLPTTLGTPSHGPLSGCGVDEPFAAAAPILARLLDAEEALLERRDSIARRAARLASAVRDEERAFLRDAPALDRATRAMHAALDDLDARVSRVAASSSGIGESLRRAAAHRAALERARKTALHLAMFNARRHDGLLDDDDDSLDVDLDDSDDDLNDASGKSPFGLGLDGDEDVVAAVFTDPKRNAEAARLAQSLLELARQHEMSSHDRVGETKPSLRVAVENLERYCDELENRLLEKFQRYEAKRDVIGMRQCARTVSHFNGGASLIRRFVATRPMFLRVEALERLDALRAAAPAYGSGLSEEKEASDAAEAALEALDVFFQETLTEATKEVATARCVFPARCDAVDQLVRRVVEQRIGAAVDATAGPKPPPPPVPGPPAASEGSYFASFMSPRKAPATTTARKHRRNVSFGGDLRGFDLAQAQPAQAPMTDFPASRLGHSRSFGMLEGRPGSGEKGEKETNDNGDDDDEEEEDTVAPLGEPAQPASPAAKTARPKTAGHSRSKSYTEYMTPSFMSSKPNAGFYGDPARDEFENSHGVGRDAIVEGTPPGAGHFALLAYLKILSGAVHRARALGAALDRVAASAGRRRVDASTACDDLFSERREGYGNLEGDCLVGLAASSAGTVPDAAPDESGIPGFDRLVRWHREASERCATVLAPPPRHPAVDSFGSIVQPVRGSADDVVDDEDDDFNDGDSNGVADSEKKDPLARVARAVASASALRESVDEELALAETFVGETERLCRLALDAAVDECERRSGRFDGRSDPRDVAETGIGSVLRAARDALDAVERARDANARICDAIEARTRDASADIESDVASTLIDSVPPNSVVEDLTGSLRIARRAAEACRVAVDGRHAECVRDVSDAVVAASRKGLKSLMFVVEKTLTGLQRRADFKPNEEEMESWTQFPGQEPTPACAAALALVREAYNVAAECLPPEDESVESSVQESPDSEGSLDANIRTFAEDCAATLHKTVMAHVARFHHTATGALQLKRDVGEFDAFVRTICGTNPGKSSPASRAWRDALDRCNALIVSAQALPELLRETRAAAVADAEAERARRGIEEAGIQGGERDGDGGDGGDEEERRARIAKEAGDAAVEEMVRIVHLRADFHPAMLKVLSPKKGRPGDE